MVTRILKPALDLFEDIKMILNVLEGTVVRQLLQ